MTKLERRIAEVAEAIGRNAYVGRQGHKDEWFAGCAGVECGGPTGLAALESVVHEMQRRASAKASEAAAEAKTAERLRAL